MSEFSRKRPLVAYFALAYAISWALWLPLVASVQGWWSQEVPEWWHYTGAAGPVTAALIVSWWAEGADGVRSLLGQYRLSRVPLGWLAFAVLMPLCFLALGLIATRLADGAWPSYDELTSADNLPDLSLPVMLALHVLTFGLGEETGWRGFALPRLQVTAEASKAAAMLAVWWGLWHVPTFFENPSFMDMGPFELAGWSVGLWMGSLFLAWLYNSSGGSLIVVVAWHGLFNLFAASNAPATVPAVLSMGVILVALAALRLAGPEEADGPTARLGPAAATRGRDQAPWRRRRRRDCCSLLSEAASRAARARLSRSSSSSCRS